MAMGCLGETVSPSAGLRDVIKTDILLRNNKDVRGENYAAFSINVRASFIVCMCGVVSAMSIMHDGVLVLFLRVLLFYVIC